MNNGIKVFQNEQFGKVRTLDEDGKVLFAAVDVARALGYSNTNDAIGKHCRRDGVAKREGVSETTNQHGKTTMQAVEMTYITESNVYRLIAHSRLPAAEKFERWVFDEVLPTIRQYGAYVPDMNKLVEQVTKVVLAAILPLLEQMISHSQPEQDIPKPIKRIRRRITSLIDQLEAPLQLEAEEMILDTRYSYQMISEHFRDQYGLLISKSSIGRYAQRMYDAIEAQENAGIR